MDFQMKLVLGAGRSKLEIDTIPQVMTNASSVFRSMLQPDRFAEGQKLSEGRPFTVTLPEGDPNAMKIVCNILHLRTKNVQSLKMTSDILVAIATVVDKYDCATAIQPWPSVWLPKIWPPEEKPWDVNDMSFEGIVEWIHISCELGYEEQFRQCTAHLISKKATHGVRNISGYGDLSGKVRGNRKCPTRRHFLIPENLSRYHRSLEIGEHCKAYPRSDFSEAHKRESFHCSSIALGNAILAAQDACGGKSWEQIENWQGNPDEIYVRMIRYAEELDGVVYMRHSRSYGGPSDGVHHSCVLSSKVRGEVDEVYDGLQRGLELSEVGNHAYRTAVTSQTVSATSLSSRQTRKRKTLA